MTPESLPGVMVFGFDRPHQPGSVCLSPCEQCGAPTEINDSKGDPLPDIPLFIVAAASEEDWLRAAGGNRAYCEQFRGWWPYFYFVTTD